MISSNDSNISFPQYVPMQTVYDGSYVKRALRSWSALWAILLIVRLQFFATLASHLYICAGDAFHSPETAVDNVLLPGTEMYRNGNSPESHIAARLLSMYHASRPGSGVGADFRGRDTDNVEMPAFVGAKEAAKTAELGGPEDQEEGGEEEEEEGGEEEAEEDKTGKQGTEQSSTKSKSNGELEGDQIIGGVIEEDENSSKPKNRVDKAGSGGEATEKKESFHIQQEAPAETKRTVEEKTIHEKNVRETHESPNAPSGAAHEGDDDDEQKHQKTSEEDDQPAHLPPKHGSAVDGGGGNDADTAKFKIQFSFKPDVVIPSTLKSAVHHSEIVDSKGKKWYQVASSTQPQLLKIERNEADIVYHSPEVNYA